MALRTDLVVPAPIISVSAELLLRSDRASTTCPDRSKWYQLRRPIQVSQLVRSTLARGVRWRVADHGSGGGTAQREQVDRVEIRPGRPSAWGRPAAQRLLADPALLCRPPAPAGPRGRRTGPALMAPGLRLGQLAAPLWPPA